MTLLAVALAAAIDFKACRPGAGSVAGPQGSTRWEVVGKSRQGCVLLWGAEVEDPRWDGFLDSTCVVPFSVGVFRPKPTGNAGADMSPLAPYCGPTPRPKTKPSPT